MDAILKPALATPPISNEGILKRSKESHELRNYGDTLLCP